MLLSVWAHVYEKAAYSSAERAGCYRDLTSGIVQTCSAVNTSRPQNRELSAHCASGSHITLHCISRDSLTVMTAAANVEQVTANRAFGQQLFSIKAWSGKKQKSPGQEHWFQTGTNTAGFEQITAYIRGGGGVIMTMTNKYPAIFKRQS